MRNIRFVTYSIVAVVALAFVPARCGDATVNLRIGSYITPTSVWGRAVTKTMKTVGERTDGRVKVTHIHSGALGSNRSMLEQVMQGAVQGAGIDTSTLATVIPEMNVFEMPFLFDDRGEAYYLIDKIIWPELREKLHRKGLVTSAIIEIGFMDFLMPAAIHRPEDLRKMKIGSWESPVHVSFWKAMGAKPLPIPATEVMSSYMRGMVDSGANSVYGIDAWDRLIGNGIDRSRLTYTRIGFTYHAGILVLNEKAYDDIARPDREILKHELGRLTVTLREKLADDEAATFARVRKSGYNYYEMTPAERRVFVRRSAAVYKDMEKTIGKPFLDRVIAARDAYRKKHKTK